VSIALPYPGASPDGSRVIDGVPTSTILMLLVIPTIYEKLDDGRTWLPDHARRLFASGGRPSPAVASRGSETHAAKGRYTST
jgi:hydrophobic/amphiphilic exporter-1 (mainly G- bacteria), HAE1 family